MDHWFESCAICDGGFCQAFDELITEKKLKQREAARELRKEAIEKTMEKYKIDKGTASKIAPTEEALRSKYKYLVTLSKNENLGQSDPKIPSSKFNETNDNIEWAKWTWNPVTGCKHDCKYCYARDIANRFYPEDIGFNPHFYPNRLNAPQNTKIPKARKDEIGIHNVFVSSMGDLFGKWVPKKWIDQIFESIEKTPQWNFIFLTKNPGRYLEIKNWPKNCWIGATADTQIRANVACKVFGNLDSTPLKFLSCEPLEEEIILPSGNFHWLIIGGRSSSSRMPAAQPQWKWVENLLIESRSHGIKVYFKPNLTIRPKEYPI